MYLAMVYLMNGNITNQTTTVRVPRCIETRDLVPHRGMLNMPCTGGLLVGKGRVTGTLGTSRNYSGFSHCTLSIIRGYDV